jgi:nicotinamide-nucleotide amidase
MSESGGTPIVRAEIIAVGSELLTASRIDTNSLHITGRLNELGIEVRTKAVVGDDAGDLSDLVRQAVARADLVVITGGLGPTDDDLTRDAVAAVFARPLIEDAATVERIRERFARRGLKMPEINRRQALVPQGAELLANPHGTAPGLVLTHGGTLVVLLPGPPREMQPMLETVIATRLAARTGGMRLYRRVLAVAGRSESHVEERAQPVYSAFASGAVPISTTILAAPGQIELHLTARAADEAAARGALERAAAALAAALGADLFTTDGRPLEAVVGDLLRERGLRVAVGESCTGGLLASRLTDVPGSSDYVQLGVVAYSNAAKTALLGVAPSLIEEHGAVSEPVAAAMAEGARERGRAEIGIGVTGIAGPGGGTDRKPVGTVAIAILGPAGAERVRTFGFLGHRQQIKFQATQTALDHLRRALLGL